MDRIPARQFPPVSRICGSGDGWREGGLYDLICADEMKYRDVTLGGLQPMHRFIRIVRACFCETLRGRDGHDKWVRDLERNLLAVLTINPMGGGFPA